MKKRIITVDYGMGNLWSIRSAIQYLGHDSVISADPEEIRRAEFLILPGVGSFRKAMTTLTETGLSLAILDAVKGRGSRILGICLGMQLLGISGTEDGFTEGLALIPTIVDSFTPEELAGNKTPHVGFNTVNFTESKGLFQGLPSNSDFYFVHSFRMSLNETLSANVGICTYGTPFLAAFQSENICGTQFHPEKSQTNGLVLLNNFINN